MITGGIKFFDTSKTLEVIGGTISASSGSSSASYAIDLNPVTRWRSVGSNDTTTETLILEFDSATINRLFLLDHNWKGYVVQYDVAGTWTHFTNVRGIDGLLSNITETAFADGSSYYEFDSVTTTKIRIQVTTTQVANEEKHCAQIAATIELGTLQGFPEVDGVEVDRNSRVKKTLSGRVSIQKSAETFSTQLIFKGYPTSSTYKADLDLIMTLHDKEVPFLIWLCGGRRGVTYFRYTLRGFRLQDLIQVQISKKLDLKYLQSVYVNPVSFKVDFEEAISVY